MREQPALLSTLLKADLGFLFQFADPRLPLGWALAVEEQRGGEGGHKHTDRISG